MEYVTQGSTALSPSLSNTELSLSDKQNLIQRGMNLIPTNLADMSEQDIQDGLSFTRLRVLSNIVNKHAMDFDDTVNSFIASYAGREGTATTYRAGIKCYERFCEQTGITNPLAVNKATIRNYRTWLISTGKANKTINNYITAVRLLFDWAISETDIEAAFENPAEQRRLSVKGSVTKKEKHTPSEQECAAILEYTKGVNEEVYYTLYYQYKFGLRIDSFANMKLSGGIATYTSKGRKCLTPMIIPPNERENFKRLIEYWREKGTYNLMVLVNRYLAKIYNEGITEYRYTSHRFRANFAQEELLNGVPMAEVSKRMNHRSPTSIGPYAEGMEQRLSAYEGLRLAYK